MTDRSTDSECRDDGVPDEETDTETGTNSPGGGSRITKLESIVEDQQQELEFLRSKMIAQEEDLANLSEGSVPLQRIDQLEERIGWLGDEVRNAIPRIAALTEVSDLSDSGVCPRCDGELTVRTSFTDVSSPSAIECPDCDLVVGHRM
ncbi:hypothetical protein [Halorubrum lipolyticum]|uniref:hypothetical protein n=1 Tax=Halorubrum lipolyticum TaxID=368624 RepID=UPI001F4C5EF4|nr:hypothetical protein [Halorubrum lipolyticum]